MVQKRAEKAEARSQRIEADARERLRRTRALESEVSQLREELQSAMQLKQQAEAALAAATQQVCVTDADGNARC